MKKKEDKIKFYSIPASLMAGRRLSLKQQLRSRFPIKFDHNLFNFDNPSKFDQNLFNFDNPISGDCKT